jgi:hypothetical protein
MNDIKIEEEQRIRGGKFTPVSLLFLQLLSGLPFLTTEPTKIP